MRDGPHCQSRAIKMKTCFMMLFMGTIVGFFTPGAAGFRRTMRFFPIGEAFQPFLQIGHQLIPVACGGFPAADKHMVRANSAIFRQNFLGEGAKAAFDTIAHHRIAGFFGDGIACASGIIAVTPDMNDQNKAGRNESPAAIRTKKFAALFQRSDARGRRARVFGNRCLRIAQLPDATLG